MHVTGRASSRRKTVSTEHIVTLAPQALYSCQMTSLATKHMYKGARSRHPSGMLTKAGHHALSMWHPYSPGCAVHTQQPDEICNPAPIQAGYPIVRTVSPISRASVRVPSQALAVHAIFRFESEQSGRDEESEDMHEIDRVTTTLWAKIP